MAAGPALGDGGGGCEAFEAAPLRSPAPALPPARPSPRASAGGCAPPPSPVPPGDGLPAPPPLAPSCGSAHLGLRRGPTRSAKSLAAPQLGCGWRRSFGTGRAQPGSPSGAGPRGGAAGRRPPELRAARSESWELVGSCSHVAALEGWALQDTTAAGCHLGCPTTSGTEKPGANHEGSHHAPCQHLVQTGLRMIENRLLLLIEVEEI
ncbi:formin-like protein 5 [Lagopus leucura]|uniref:formin-like protein 5 n=1 Tax=Lagopus leucura TaxID=30410 RepID=UPI001C6766A6|nr:formin-like protein 5 [Lagopus leucura]